MLHLLQLVLLSLQLVTSTTNNIAQSAVDAAPASDGASSASMDVGPAAVGATSSQVAASPT